MPTHSAGRVVCWHSVPRKWLSAESRKRAAALFMWRLILEQSPSAMNNIPAYCMQLKVNFALRHYYPVRHNKIRVKGYSVMRSFPPSTIHRMPFTNPTENRLELVIYCMVCPSGNNMTVTPVGEKSWALVRRPRLAPAEELISLCLFPLTCPSTARASNSWCRKSI